MEHRRNETCQRLALLKLRRDMNLMHANMGGRTNRPERVALVKCMAVLTKHLDTWSDDCGT